MTEIPTWNERQRILYSPEKKSDPAILTELGQACLKKGRVQEAFEYFRGAKDLQGLNLIRDLATEEGDIFLLEALEKATEPLSTDILNRAAYRAFELGKYKFAQRAFERTQNELMLAKIRSVTGEVAEPPAPSDDSPSA